MIKNYLLLAILMASFQLFSQEIYLNAGKNFTNYNYKNAIGVPDSNLQSGTGNSYSIGLNKRFINEKKLGYSLGLSLNEYNALGGGVGNLYRWDTKYMGVTGGLTYSFFPEKAFDFLVDFGLNGSTIIYGKQEINGVAYDLVHQKEFTGVLLGSTMGFQAKYKIPSFGYLSLGYDFCQNVNISNTSKEKLTFSTHQIQLGFHFPINY